MSFLLSRVVIIPFFALLVTAPVFGQDTVPTQWTELFNGKDLNGWKHDSLGKAEYTVVDGTIHGVTVEGSPNSFLYTEKEYADFELEFEVRVHDQLNSGVQIRSREKNVADVEAEAAKSGKGGKKNEKNASLGRFHGPQIEIEASPGQAGYIYGEATGLGWLSKEPKDDKHSHDTMKNGEWNQYRVVAKGPRIQTWINGKPVADLTHEEIYKTHPSGHIAVQVHGIKAGSGPFDVSWRNLRIRELK